MAENRNVRGNHINPKSVSTGEVVIDPHDDRPLWSASNRTISVPGDYDTIQAAVDDIPHILRHRYIIEADSTYDGSSEDLYIPPLIGPRKAILEADETIALRIIGDSSDPVPLGSAFIDGVAGMPMRLSGFEMQHSNPLDNEDAMVGVYGCSGRVLVSDLSIAPDTPASVGAVIYSSNATLERIDFGSDYISNAVRSKHGGTVYIQDCTGSVTDSAARVNKAQAFLQDSDISASNQRMNVDTVGIVNDNNSEFFGLNLTSGIEGSRRNDWYFQSPGTGPVIRDSNGGWWRLVVDSDGNLSTESVTV